MKVAIATRNWDAVAGHAGQARHWLVFDFRSGPRWARLPEPARIELEKAQVLHHFDDVGPHPLDGVDVVIAGGAGDGFVRHIKKRGAAVVLTSEADPVKALDSLVSGRALPGQRFDITTALCKVRDLFSRH